MRGGVQLLFGQCPFAQSFFYVGRLPLQLKRGIKTKRFPHHSIFVVSTVCNNKHCSWWCNNVQVVHSFQEQCLQRSGTQSRTALENVCPIKIPKPTPTCLIPGCNMWGCSSASHYMGRSGGEGGWNIIHATSELLSAHCGHVAAQYILFHGHNTILLQSKTTTQIPIQSKIVECNKNDECYHMVWSGR